jgi:hypothetical protein
MLKLHGGLLRFSQISTRFMETLTVLVCPGEFFILRCLNNNFIEAFTIKFRLFEKHTKFEKNLPHGFDL